MADNNGNSPARRSSYAGPANPTRRLSYASVVTGSGTAASSNLSSSSQPTRAGALASSLATTNPASAQAQAEARYHARPHDQDLHSYMSQRRSSSFNAASHKRASMMGASGSTQPFFIPSYLENSRYAQKLQAAYETRVRQHRELHSAGLIHPSTLWGPAGNAKLAPSHRGMTYDVVESNPPQEDDVMPLPTRLNLHDKYPGLDLQTDGYTVKYNGAHGKDLEAASIRADFPMPPPVGLYYFEVTIKQKHKDCAVGIGFSGSKCSLERLPGWEPESWAYHSDDGKRFWGENSGQPFGPVYGVNDVIGCGLDFNKKQCFFTKNGNDLGVAFKDLTDLKAYPCVGIKKFPGSVITVNFGQDEFVYDIRSRMEGAESTVRTDIARTKTNVIHNGQNEAHFTQELIAQFLSHGGYIETAKAFAAQTQQERQSLSGGSSSQLPPWSSHSPDARPRQQIRHAILKGDIQSALSKTQEQFPDLEAQSPEVVFQLKCRYFIELLITATAPALVTKSSNGVSNGQAKPDVSEMDLDEDQTISVYRNGKAPEHFDSAIDDSQSMSEAIAYGQSLRAEYYDKDDTYKKDLDDIFSLLAYSDPSTSPNGKLLRLSERTRVAESLNSAILNSLGRSPTAMLETIWKQTESLIDVLSASGGPAAFVNLQQEVKSDEF